MTIGPFVLCAAVLCLSDTLRTANNYVNRSA